ncbi:unnamed protein product [Nippostrongylus brasiliensis]|uniref:DUF982 domain-containing protein n=1 Tax=Nippostrongylus brasiliensis TaxID=27835 RepID=A0A0N4XT76_NIPBR|nr:unnamed protein product [Nippostrongylus brasiliensis]
MSTIPLIRLLIGLHSQTALRHELMCPGKLIGHPLVIMEGGSEDSHNKASERNNIAATRRWPSVALRAGTLNVLKKAIARNIDPESNELAEQFGPMEAL